MDYKLDTTWSIWAVWSARLFQVFSFQLLHGVLRDGWIRARILNKQYILSSNPINTIDWKETIPLSNTSWDPLPLTPPAARYPLHFHWLLTVCICNSSNANCECMPCCMMYAVCCMACTVYSMSAQIESVPSHTTRAVVVIYSFFFVSKILSKMDGNQNNTMFL